MAEITRVFDLLEHSLEKHRKEDMVAAKQNGIWNKYSTEKFVAQVNSVSQGLIASGIEKDNKVAIMSANRPEWNICDFGIMQIGATQVPMYPTLAENDIKFILRDADVKIVFVSESALYEKLNNVRKTEQLDFKIFSFDSIEGVPHWKELIEIGERAEPVNLQVYRDRILPDDLLTLIYTSGTTGTPKGVMLTHSNLVSNVIASSVLYPAGFKKALSFLPLSHIFERMVLYMYFYLGVSVYYAQSMETIAADLVEVKPHGFTTVPRLLEKVYDRIVAKGSELTGVKKQLFFWALNLGLRYEMNGANGLWYEVQLKLANKLIFNKWRDALGGNILAVVSGGAALQSRLARVFWAAGMPVLEGYGLTETSPVIAVNGLTEGAAKFTTVGKAIRDVEIKIAEDGEILCKGPNVMKGYYNRPDLSDEVIDKDGFFHTGDIGELVDGQYLRITDRKKEIFKTAGGKYIAPQILENKFKESPYIEQMIVIGENERFPAALILPNFPALSAWCSRSNIPFSNNADMIKDQRVIDKIQSVVDHFNKDFGHWEQVKKFELLTEDWSIDGGELTPKLSLKRKVILQKYKDQVDKIYKNA
ncbi:MAG: long-chain fatty acid--CoA ligase [Sphingobacteriales bacterium 17-39-43]|uniref:AMP-dependent synthetase/ligase n=1 Tax=Daejeonella sp. TaxID=2805397 RepID=UPI000BD160F5|nr:long-chain fatty acid--CoA ligase [Daejeonella sp.]OYZ30870.1 MAG: long-chain fatty acid--CoA ligase [Sphingobacteriales bacterium 16-39-50]OYZ56560.1 MAG: long-chain fatty acid--CoA ligase [Sphingobacteriales bacterium 24-40-4]OZA23656.1 MAG: long-chain fatty acid--CoA ligase [Sphingobacteriales bacterium 17-39-43]OZA61447.1 MAG: long-chain fatty acid--CoA ligase [Sphingobacteriales bacterium 39-40-5]HQS05683.1 long-chain fatty acid--CoA ligase [Daejeonella sp.]